ncbi:MAG: hypothetical protein J7559_12430, partial [Cohnella sp.]|nr:hypothetical protein [Cohnella sp.]
MLCNVPAWRAASVARPAACIGRSVSRDGSAWQQPAKAGKAKAALRVAATALCHPAQEGAAIQRGHAPAAVRSGMLKSWARGGSGERGLVFRSLLVFRILGTITPGRNRHSP